MLVGGGTLAALTATAPWILGGLSGLVEVRPAAAEPGEIYDDDRILGSPEAAVTIIEYSSLTCPNCASFHNDTLPQVKKDWIETEKARLVYRHFPLDGLALRAALIADCLPGKRYFGFLDVLFRSQDRWMGAEDPAAALNQMAKLAGLDQATVDACTADEDAIDLIVARTQEARETYQVSGTPTFIVNGQKVDGALEYEDFKKMLEEAVSGS